MGFLSGGIVVGIIYRRLGRGRYSALSAPYGKFIWDFFLGIYVPIYIIP